MTGAEVILFFCVGAGGVLALTAYLTIREQRSEADARRNASRESTGG